MLWHRPPANAPLRSRAGKTHWVLIAVLAAGVLFGFVALVAVAGFFLWFQAGPAPAPVRVEESGEVAQATPVTTRTTPTLAAATKTAAPSGLSGASWDGIEYSAPDGSYRVRFPSQPEKLEPKYAKDAKGQDILPLNYKSFPDRMFSREAATNSVYWVQTHKLAGISLSIGNDVTRALDTSFLISPYLQSVPRPTPRPISGPKGPKGGGSVSQSTTLPPPRLKPAACGNYPGGETSDLAPPDLPTPTIARTVCAGGTLYILGVSGAAPEADRERFFGSLKLARGPEELPPLPAGEPADILPIASLPDWVEIAFAPKANAVFILRHATDPAPRPMNPPDPALQYGQLRRYHYPTFKFEAEYRLPTGGASLAIDEEAGRIVAAWGGGGTDPRTGTFTSGCEVATFALPALPRAGDPPPRLPALTRQLLPGVILQGMVVRDGAIQLFVREPYFATAPQRRAVRLKDDTLEVTGDAKLHAETIAMCPVPGKPLLYFATHNSSASQIQVFDTEKWAVQLSVPTLSTLKIAAAPSGTLFFNGSSSYSITALVALDPTGPTQRIPSTRPEDKLGEKNILLSPDGTRLYVTRDDTQARTQARIEAMKQAAKTGQRLPTGPEAQPPTWIEAWDTEQAVKYGRIHVVGRVPVPRLPASTVEKAKPKSGERYIPPSKVSPDGKCVITDTGLVYWLPGAGPVPDVAPDVKLELPAR